MERGINLFFNCAFLTFLFSIGFYWAYSGETTTQNTTVRFNHEVEDIYKKLSIYQDKIEKLHEIYDKALPKALDELAGFEEAFEVIKPQLELTSIYKHKIREGRSHIDAHISHLRQRLDGIKDPKT